MSEKIGVEWTLSPHKRALDLLGMTALMPVFAPAGAAIAVSIRSIDDMDPVFTQTRYGLQFEPFPFYKFRTMPPDTPDTPSTGSSDSRRTPLGTKLSEKHLDEMLQTINVYDGTMSLVGPRALIWQDVSDTLDVLTPKEQEKWIGSRWIAKPGEFGRFQLDQHVGKYQSGSRIEFLKARAYSDIDYGENASFRTDMDIVLDTAKAVYNTFNGNEDDGHLRGESGAQMFHAVANGFGVDVTEQEHEWWRATLLAARCLDDVVDEEGVRDLSSHIADLEQGKSINGMTQAESEAFREAYQKATKNTQQTLRGIYLALPSFAERKKASKTTRELLRVNTQEAEIFARLLFLEPSDSGRIKFNHWLNKFAQTGYLADLALDSRKDYASGNIGILPSATDRIRFGTHAAVDSVKLLAAAPRSSYGDLARGVVKTLMN